MSTRTAFCLALALSAAPGTALAQEESEAPAGARPFETLTIVGTRTERALGDVAATVSVKSADEIEQELARDIADLVRFEPGVTVAGTGSRFGLGGFTIRGIGGNRVLTVIDGVRVPEEFSFGPFLSARRDFVDVDTLARAEIARGPISSLYGSDALGGVVAFTTKGPRGYLDANEPWHADFKAGYSGADDSTVGTLTLAAGGDWISGLLLLTRREGHVTKNQGEIGGTGEVRELPDPQDIETDNIIAKIALHPGDAHELNLAVDLYDNRTDTRVLSDYGEVAFGTVTNRRDAHDERDRSRVSLRYRYDGDLVVADDLSATLYRQESETRQVTDEDRTTASGQPQTRLRVSTFDQDIEGAVVQFGKLFEAAGSSHLLMYGADYYVTENASLRAGGSFDASAAPVFEFLPLPTRDFPLTEVEQLAFFLQDEIDLLNGRLKLSPGLRYDRFEADATADEIYLSGNPGSPAPEDYSDSEITAKIGLLYAFSDAFSAFARYSEGFRAPPYDDVNVGFSNFVGGYKTIANPKLESEQSAGIEAGFRWQGGAGTLSVAAFRNEYDNFIESFAIAPAFLPTGGIDPADGLLTFQSVNRKEVEIQGAELGGTLQVGAVDDRLAGFSLRAAVAYADGEDKETGAPINRIEPLTAVLGMGYDSRGDRWGAELVWTLVEDKDPDDIDAGSPQMPTAGYGVLDLLAHVAIGDRVRVNAGLFNLLDKTYIRWADTAAMGADAPARFTQPGFNAGATVRIEW